MCVRLDSPGLSLAVAVAFTPPLGGGCCGNSCWLPCPGRAPLPDIICCCHNRRRQQEADAAKKKTADLLQAIKAKEREVKAAADKVVKEVSRAGDCVVTGSDCMATSNVLSWCL